MWKAGAVAKQRFVNTQGHLLEEPNATTNQSLCGSAGIGLGFIYY